MLTVEYNHLFKGARATVWMLKPLALTLGIFTLEQMKRDFLMRHNENVLFAEHF